MKNQFIDYTRRLTMPLLLVAVFIIAAFVTSGSILRPQNISNLVLQNAYIIVIACGMLLCILTGGHIDLSVGSTLCLSGALVAQLLGADIPVAMAILFSLGVSLAIGVLQGFLIGYVKIPPFICTLASMFIIRGVARVVTESKTVVISNEEFFDVFGSYIQIPGIDHDGFFLSAIIFGVVLSLAFTITVFVSLFKNSDTNSAKKTYTVIGVLLFDAALIAYCCMLAQYKGLPVMFVCILIIVAFFIFFLSKTVFGRYFYAVGGNKEAAKLSGIDSRKVMFWAYLIVSLLAGLSGLFVATRIGSVDGNMGSSYEMDAIAACFIGGASAYGGTGTIQGAVVGALLLGVINMTMSILGLPDQWQYIVKGTVLLLAVLFDVLSNRNSSIKAK